MTRGKVPGCPEESLVSEHVPADRACPTRSDGVAPLIVHWITPPICLERQRRNYHKCPLCQYRGLGAKDKLPVPPPRTVTQLERRAVSEAG